MFYANQKHATDLYGTLIKYTFKIGNIHFLVVVGKYVILIGCQDSMCNEKLV